MPPPSEKLFTNIKAPQAINNGGGAGFSYAFHNFVIILSKCERAHRPVRPMVHANHNLSMLVFEKARTDGYVIAKICHCFF